MTRDDADGAASERRPTRRQRQHDEVIALTLRGERDRAAVLGREHLREFPDDLVVAEAMRSNGLA